MNAKTVNGILFIIAGIAPLVIYLGLGPDGTGILEANLTEKLATWVMFSAPIAIMMTRDAIKSGAGHGIVSAGFLIMIIALPVGIVADVSLSILSFLQTLSEITFMTIPRLPSVAEKYLQGLYDLLY